MLGWLRKKSATYTLDQLAGLAEFVRYGSASGATVSPSTAVQVTAVLCAVRVISEGLAQMPVRVISESYDESDRLQRKVERDHWAHTLLSQRPNSFQTGFEFCEYAITAALLDKGFLGIKNVQNGRVREIYPMPIGSWSMERVSQSADHFFRITHTDGTASTYRPDQVVYLRGPSLDGWRSLPALSAAREAIGLASVLERQQSQLAANGGKPSGVLGFEETLSPERRDKLRELWQERFGPNGEGGVAVLDGAAKFQSMTMTSVDAQHLETRSFQVEEIARAFRVLPIMLMSSDKASTYASAEQMFRHHIIHSLGPWMRRWESVLMRDVLGNAPGLRVDLDERGLLRGDFADQAAYYTSALGAGGQPGWMTVNEIRGERDMNPVEAEWADAVPQGAMNKPPPVERKQAHVRSDDE